MTHPTIGVDLCLEKSMKISVVKTDVRFVMIYCVYNIYIYGFTPPATMTCPIPAVSLYQDLTFVRRDLLVERDLRFPAQAPWTGLRPSPWGFRICL